MVYIYACKRFKVTMDMIQGKDGEWVNTLLKTYCKAARLNAILERAEINPKRRMTTNTYDSSTDVFKINIVYKDTHAREHELQWLIKVRSILWVMISFMANEVIKEKKKSKSVWKHFLATVSHCLIDNSKLFRVERLILSSFCDHCFGNFDEIIWIERMIPSEI